MLRKNRARKMDIDARLISKFLGGGCVGCVCPCGVAHRLAQVLSVFTASKTNKLGAIVVVSGGLDFQIRSTACGCACVEVTRPSCS